MVERYDEPILTQAIFVTHIYPMLPFIVWDIINVKIFSFQIMRSFAAAPLHCLVRCPISRPASILVKSKNCWIRQSAEKILKDIKGR
jgi:hypothetical protein